MSKALIGYSGFVGSTLLKQTNFDYRYRSNNIGNSSGLSFDTVVCAGAPAQKWLANKDPQSDWKTITGLIAHLQSIECKTFILISTVDVFRSPTGVTEETFVDEVGLYPYGLHRRQLEKFVEEHFPRYLIVRLPGLVGPGLRKNVIFDFLNRNNLEAVDSRNIFQFYPMVNLWYDIQLALKMNVKIIHLTAEPISVSDIILQGFGTVFHQPLLNTPIKYDMKSQYAQFFGAPGSYQYTIRDTIHAVRNYAQSEPQNENTDNRMML